MKANIKPQSEQHHSEADHELPHRRAPDWEPEGSSNRAPARAERLSSRPSERDEILDRTARMQAEFENSRKWAAQELDELREFALENTLKSLLPILDSLDRALNAPAKDIEKFRSGVGLIRKRLHDALREILLKLSAFHRQSD